MSENAVGRSVRSFRRSGLTDRTLAILLVLPSAALLLAFEFYPFLVAGFDSLFFTDPITGARTWAGLENFRAVLTSSDTHDAFIRSLIFVSACLAIQASLGLITALLLNAGLKGQTLARGASLLPYMVPAVVTALSFRFSLNGLYGVVNYVLLNLKVVHTPILFLDDTHIVLWSVILISSWRHTPFFTIVILARLQTLPRDLIEAADIDGASPLKIFRHITLPWLAPVLLIALLLRTVWTGVEFDTPYLVAFGGPLNASTVVPLQIYNLYTQQMDFGQASALALCVAALLLVASIFYLRSYRRTAMGA
jgi:multiple sugar transport system permease protein